MSKNILLETRTATFLDLLGNGKRHTVPPYQRDYSWTEEQWDDLWTDILAVPGPDDRHYMGALVVEAKTDRDFLVIDGQQRLATLSILSLVVIGRLQDLAAQNIDAQANRERAESLKSRFIGEKDPASLVLTSKLSLNETDDPFYQDYLVAQRIPQNPRAMPKSNRQLWECFSWFKKRISELPDVCNDGRQLAELLNEAVARRLLFILINVEDELNAYTVFETLNARGMELSSTDLLKNYLFSRVKAKPDLDAVHRRWGNLIKTVRPEHFPEFLRYHLLCSEPQIRSARLFKIVREQVKAPQDVLDLLDALDERAEFFAALRSDTDSLWDDVPACRPLIRERLLYKSQQSTPLLFAAWEKLSHDDFTRVLKMVNTITFRFTTISSLNTNELEPVYHRAAKAVLDKVAKGASQVFHQLQSIYVPDDRFRQDFARLTLASGRTSKLTKFILCRLEADASHGHRDFDTDPATVEHILPENPTSDWMAWFTERELEQYTYRLGNLTLLEPKLNRDLGNNSYASKLLSYAKSQYRITQNIAEDAPEEWNPRRVENRQKWMADRATHLWRCDYSEG